MGKGRAPDEGVTGFFKRLRDAVENQDLDEIDEVLGGSSGVSVIFQAKATHEQLRQAICSNAAKIIAICDSVLGDPKASAEDKKWYGEQKKKAQETQRVQKCDRPPVALEGWEQLAVVRALGLSDR